jgi:hypothetical protein
MQFNLCRQVFDRGVFASGQQPNPDMGPDQSLYEFGVRNSAGHRIAIVNLSDGGLSDK